MGTSHMRFGRESSMLALLLHSAAAMLVLWRIIWWSRSTLFSSQAWTANMGPNSLSADDEHVANVVKNALHASEEVRIYVYNLPPKYNTLQVAKSHQKPAPIRDPYCDENFYSAEVTVHKGLLNSKARTTDGDKADLFYVPIYVTCFLINNHPNNLTKTGMFFDEAMDHVVRKYGYFNRSQGRDHVYTFTQGFGARLAGENWRKWQNGIFLTHNGDMFSEEYVPRKDIVIPPDLSHYMSPVFKDGAQREWFALAKRSFLAQFGGQSFSSSISDHRGQNYSGGVRQYLVKEMYRTPGFRITGTRSEEYLNDMRKSMFCLAPEGWHPWSPRPYYGILLGCVPVVVSERQELAFEDVMPYDKMVVWIRPQDVFGINRVLRSISGQEILKRLQTMERMWRLFWYKEDGLALDMIVGELSRHKYNAQPQHEYRHA